MTKSKQCAIFLLSTAKFKSTKSTLSWRKRWLTVNLGASSVRMCQKNLRCVRNWHVICQIKSPGYLAAFTKIGIPKGYMYLLLVFVEVSKCLVVLTRDSRDNQRFFFFTSDRERQPDEILQNQSSPRGSDWPSIIRCRVVLIGSDGHSLLLTYIRKELWLVPHTLLGHFIVTNLHSENLHDSNSVYLQAQAQ